MDYIVGEIQFEKRKIDDAFLKFRKWKRMPDELSQKKSRFLVFLVGRQ